MSHTNRILRVMAVLSLTATVMSHRTSIAAPQATFMVTSTADSTDTNPGDGLCLSLAGGCTLRAAVQQANASFGDDVIVLPAGTYTFTSGRPDFGAASGDLEVTDNVTVQGGGQGTTIIDGGGLDRIFQVIAGATLNLSHLTVRNGSVPVGEVGGGIDVSGNLNMIAVTISHNVADEGGGLFVRAPGQADIRYTLIEHNESNETGGGVVTDLGATLILIGSTVYNNFSIKFGGGLTVGGSATVVATSVLSNTGQFSGGGVEVQPGGYLDMRQTRVWGNEAGEGAGIGVHGDVWVQGSDISENLGFSGAGLFVSPSGRLTMTTSLVAANNADDGSIFNAGIAFIERSSVINNTSLFGSGGGGVVNAGEVYLTNLTISGNTVTGEGGGLANTTGTARLANVTIVGNTAIGEGGGIWNHPDGTVFMRNSVLSANSGLSPDCSGILSSEGYNLIENMPGCTLIGTLTGNHTGVLADMGPLQLNGGPTVTHLPLAGSPTIDAGNPAGCLGALDVLLTLDQRGASRHHDGDAVPGAMCDIGAAEAGAVVYTLYVPAIVR